MTKEHVLQLYYTMSRKLVLNLRDKRMGTILIFLMLYIRLLFVALFFSSLRSLALACSRQRKDIFESPSKDIVRAEDRATWPKFISHLNLIICLVARYFDQADLADGHR